MVYLLGLGLSRSQWRLPLKLQHLLVWGGQRGGLALVLALRVRDTTGFAPSSVIAATFGVVAFSVLVQALTLQPFLRRLGPIEEGVVKATKSGEAARA